MQLSAQYNCHTHHAPPLSPLGQCLQNFLMSMCPLFIEPVQQQQCGGLTYSPREVKTLCTHIDCLTEFYLCCWSVPARSAARFGSVYYNCFLCELVFVGHKVHIKLHASKSQIKEKAARNRKHAQVARGQQWVKRQTGPMPVGARRVNNRLSS